MVPQKLNHRHRALAEWLVANPHRPLKDAAEDLGYTKEYVYQLVGTDLFRAYYEGLCRQRGALAVHTVGARLFGATLLALDRVTEALQEPKVDKRFLSDTTRVLLEAIGYKGEVPQRHLHLHVTPKDLEEAREVARRRFNDGQ